MKEPHEPLVVTLVKRHGRRQPLSHTDQVAAVHEFSRMGKSAREVSELLGMSERRVCHIRRLSVSSDGDSSTDYQRATGDTPSAGAGAMEAEQRPRKTEIIDVHVDNAVLKAAASGRLTCALATLVATAKTLDLWAYAELTS